MRPFQSQIRALVCGALAAFAAITVQAQQQSDTTRLARVVVTADRMERSVRQTPSTVTILDGAALRAAGIVLVLEALRATPGITVVQAGGPGAQASIFARGGESDYTRVLIDGVPQNDPGGAIDLSMLTTDNIDRIEIVRGPGSVSYGSDAVTAVVQVFTRRAVTSEIQMNANAGSLGQRMASVESQWRRGTLGITTGASGQRVEGALPFNNEFENSIGSIRTTYGNSASVGLRHGFSRYEYPTDGAGNAVDRNANQRERRTVANADFTRSISSAVTLAATVTALDVHRRNSDAADGPADTVGFYAYEAVGVVRRRTMDVRVQHYARPSGTTSVGVESGWEQQRSADSSNYAASFSHFNAQRSNTAVYLQNAGTGGALSWSLGGRVDDNSEFGTYGTWRAGLAAQVGPAVRLRASGGSSFKAPTFFETNATAFSNGNSDLVPERGRSLELGADVEQSWFNASLVWFDQRFRNLIQYAYADPPTPDFFNVAAARANGVEGEVSVKLKGRIWLHGAVTMLRSRVDDAGLQDGVGATFVIGSRLLRRPSFTLNGGVTAPTRFGVLSLSALRVGERDDLDFSGFPATRHVLTPYTRIDLAAQSRAVRVRGGEVGLTLRVQNATGARYHEIVNFAAPGRQIVIGVRLRSVTSTAGAGK